MKILVTGFDPFGNDKINPSIEVVKRLPKKILDSEIIKLELPTVFYKSGRILEEAIEQNKPDYVICIGQAGGRADITPERIAINIDDARIPDNEGQQPIDTIIKSDGENAYFASLPIKAIANKLNDKNIKSSISNTAGTFVCNHIMYTALYLCNKKYKTTRAGFIHIPYIKEQVSNKKAPYMELDTLVEGLTLAIEAIIDFHNKKDLLENGGKIC